MTLQLLNQAVGSINILVATKFYKSIYFKGAIHKIQLMRIQDKQIPYAQN